jgi:hypothetical protein
MQNAKGPPRDLPLCPLFFNHSDITLLWKRTPMDFTLRLRLHLPVCNSAVLNTVF